MQLFNVWFNFVRDAAHLVKIFSLRVWNRNFIDLYSDMQYEVDLKKKTILRRHSLWTASYVVLVSSKVIANKLLSELILKTVDLHLWLFIWHEYESGAVVSLHSKIIINIKSKIHQSFIMNFIITFWFWLSRNNFLILFVKTNS